MTMNPATTWGGQLQTVGGRLAAALARRGTNVADFIAWLAQQANEDAIEAIAAVVGKPAKRSLNVPVSHMPH